jgi:ABC-2 type transport system ATP-binding protein
MDAIVANNLSKRYNKGKTLAVDDISFSVQQGELFGLIGPDGAGKTSIFRMLTTLLLPDGGSAKVDGLDIVKDYYQIRQRVGYMPGKFSLYPDLTVQENLQFFATVFGTTIEANYHLVKDIYEQLQRFKDRRAGKLSGGMKQKLALCCALIHKPTILFLDEPTTGVDVVSRKEFWDMLQKLKTQGITILVSTPYMDEAARCERIALMHQGKILGIDTPEKISQALGQTLYSIKTNQGMYALLQGLQNYEGMHSAYAFGDAVHYTDKHAGDSDVVTALGNYLRAKGHGEVAIVPIAPGVEDSFIQLITRQNKEKA